MIMLHVNIPNFIILNIIMPNVIRLAVIVVTYIRLDVIVLSVIMFMCVVNLRSVNKLDLTWKQSFLILLICYVTL